MIIADGEPIMYKSFVHFDAQPDKIEYLFDAAKVFKEYRVIKDSLTVQSDMTPWLYEYSEELTRKSKSWTKI